MKEWTVKFLLSVSRDLQRIYDYYADVQSESRYAEKLVNLLIDSANSLNTMPFRYPPYPYEPWKSKGFRTLYKNSHVIFYLPDESKNDVLILGVVYGSRDIEAWLHKNEFDLSE